MHKYLDIHNISQGMEDKVRQDLKFKTGRFLWKVKFNTPLDPRTVNNVNLYVTNSSQTPLSTSIHYDTLSNIIEIEPLEPYAQNEVYTLNISTAVKSKGGSNLKTPVQLQFKID
ncbi:MAG: Ig-like domain-containing protein [Acetivibrio sp.]